jgi:peptidoglycan/LPS O-acetylase OafA/YrhL
VGGLRYQPALDGLRGIAVLAVIGYHLGYLRGGFLGVDIFFVLSGYLITSILLEERYRTGGIRLGAFWARRARRLLPALLLLLVALAAWNVHRPFSNLRGDGLATLFYVANWHLIGGQSYFAQFASPSPLRHTWSLAIEEQFYIVWPLVAAWFAAKARFVWGVAAAIVGSAILQAVLYRPADPSAAYYNTFARAHEIFVGALVALLGAKLIGKLAWPAFLLVLAAIAFLPDRAAIYYRGGSVVFAVLAAAVVVGQPRILASKPLRALGTISYGVYLWHWPVFLIVTPAIGVRGALLNVVRVALTLAIATVSYHLVEQPVRKGTYRVEWPGVRRRMVAAGAFVGVFTLLATAAVPTATAAGTIALADGGEEIGSAWSPVVVGGSGPNLVIVGDSVAAVLAPAFVQVSGFRVISATRRGCAVTGAITTNLDGTLPRGRQDCHDQIGRLQKEAMQRYKPRVIVMYSQTEALPIEGVTPALGRAHIAAMTSLMQTTYERLTAGGAHLVVIAPLLRPPPANGCADTLARATCADTRRFNEGIIEFANVLHTFAESHPLLTFVDVSTLVCGSPYRCPFKRDGLVWRPDGVHFTIESGARVARQVTQVIDRLRLING